MSKLHLKPVLETAENAENLSDGAEWEIYCEGIERCIGVVKENKEEEGVTYEFSYYLGTTQYVSDGWGTLDSCTNNFFLNFKDVLENYLELMK